MSLSERSSSKESAGFWNIVHKTCSTHAHGFPNHNGNQAVWADAFECEIYMTQMVYKVTDDVNLESRAIVMYNTT